MTRAFQGGLLLPLLGVLFVPFTCLVYVIVYIPGIGLTGLSWIWVIIALLIDLGSHSTGVYAMRSRLARYRAAGR